MKKTMKKKVNKSIEWLIEQIMEKLEVDRMKAITMNPTIVVAPLARIELHASPSAASMAVFGSRPCFL